MAKSFLYRADIENVLWVHDFPAYLPQLPSLAKVDPTADFDPDTTLNDVYAVEFQLVNIHGADADTLSIYIDPNGGAGITDPAFPVVNAKEIAAKTTHPSDSFSWLGPYIIRGTHSIVVDAVTGSKIVVHWRIKHVADDVAFSGSQASRT